MLSEQVATLSKALHLPPAAATYGQAVVTDWSPAKARKQALSDAHLAVAASDRLTPLIEPVANHLNTVYAELVRHQVRAEPYWFQKLEVMPGLFSPGWSDPAKDKLPYYGLT